MNEGWIGRDLLTAAVHELSREKEEERKGELLPDRRRRRRRRNERQQEGETWQTDLEKQSVSLGREAGIPFLGTQESYGKIGICAHSIFRKSPKPAIQISPTPLAPMHKVFGLRTYNQQYTFCS